MQSGSDLFFCCNCKVALPPQQIKPRGKLRTAQLQLKVLQMLKASVSNRNPGEPHQTEAVPPAACVNACVDSQSDAYAQCWTSSVLILEQHQLLLHFTTFASRTYACY